MKITESKLRRIIREEILGESLEGFLQRAKDISYSASHENPTFEDNPSARIGSKGVKRAWAEEVKESGSRSFFDKELLKIHWMSDGSEKNIHALVASRGRDEIATMGYLPGTGVPTSRGWGRFGLVIQGWTTLAVNNMDYVYSGFHNKQDPSIKAKYKSSGVPKRASFFNSGSRSAYILDKDSFSVMDQGLNELIVANWRVSGAVFDEVGIHYISEMLDQIRSGRHSAVDFDRNVWFGILRALKDLKIPLIFDDQREIAEEWHKLFNK